MLLGKGFFCLVNARIKEAGVHGYAGKKGVSRYASELGACLVSTKVSVATRLRGACTCCFY